MIRILLVGNQATCNAVGAQLQQEDFQIVGALTSETGGMDEINRSSPDIILMTDISSMTVRIYQQVYLLRPRSIPVVMVPINDMATVQNLIDVGVHHFLPTGLKNNELGDKIRDIYKNESNRIQALENTEHMANKAKVILVFGTKGGSGRSTVAVNLAVALASRNLKVSLLDYDLQFGDISTMLGINPKSSIMNLIQTQEGISIDNIRQYMTLHSSGVNVLAAPSSPEYAETVSTEKAEKVLSILRMFNDYVVIDVAPTFSDLVLSCIDNASEILFVTNMDIASLKDTKKGLDVMARLVEDSKIKLVINKEYKSGISQEDVQRVLGIPVWHMIPDDSKLLLNAVNFGKPALWIDPRSAFCQSIRSLVVKIEPNSVEAEMPAQKSRMPGILQKKRV